eukprot:5294303-Prymnesium_polylepis.1
MAVERTSHMATQAQAHVAQLRAELADERERVGAAVAEANEWKATAQASAASAAATASRLAEAEDQLGAAEERLAAAVDASRNGAPPWVCVWGGRGGAGAHGARRSPPRAQCTQHPHLPPTPTRAHP